MYNSFCLRWRPAVKTLLPASHYASRRKVKTAADIEAYLEKSTRQHNKTGILLSVGIDSAILASFLPKGTKAYIMRCRTGKTAMPDAPLERRQWEPKC